MSNQIERNDGWHAAARQLGLTPFLATAPFSEGDSFPQLMSRLGMAATRPTSTEHIVAGTAGDVRVLLATYGTPHMPGIPNNNSIGGDHSHWTAVVTELDPNLQLGLRAERSTALSDFLRGRDLQVGLKVVDDTLRIQALDIGKLRQLLLPRDAHDQLFVEKICVAAGRGLFISDSMLGYKLEGEVVDAITLQGALHDLLGLRQDLALRATRMVATPYDIELRHQWAAFGNSAGLAFDPQRVSLQGVVRGVPVELTHEGAPSRLQLAVRCRFPQPIAAQVRLTKMRPQLGMENTPPSRVNRAPGQYLEVGDSAFDNAFQVQGYPIEPAQAAFSSPAFRAQLLTLARVASHVDLTHEGVSWFFPRPPQGAAELADHLEMAVSVARSRGPQAELPGPYR